MVGAPGRAEKAAVASVEHGQASEMAAEEGSDFLSKILVVDDEEVVCRFLEKLLAAGGHEVHTSLGGQDAIAKLEEDSFDLVITDLKMPGVDGVGVLRKAKELDPFCEIIVITAYASVESAVEVMKLGAYDYISKPFNIDRIRLVVDKAIEKRRLLRAAGERDFYKRLSQMDDLTEVYNRRRFDELLGVEIARSDRYRGPLSLLMIDLDHLKVINDTFGHRTGDEVLKRIAELLKKSVRNCDVVARYGGDEFVVILVETAKADAMSAANRLARLIGAAGVEQNEALPEGDRWVTVSIGVASYPTDARGRSELMEKADQALYEAKAHGGNSVSPAGT